MGKAGSHPHTAFCTKTPDIRLARQSNPQQAADMVTDDDLHAIIEPVETPAPDDADDSLRFVRGLVYGLACVAPFWGVVIVSAWRAL